MKPEHNNEVTPHHISTLGKIIKVCGVFFTYIFFCQINKIKYLRKTGVWVGEGCEILNSISDFGSEPWLIRIGDRVTLTSGVKLVTHDAASRLFRKYLPGSSKYGNRFGKIDIHNDCFIGVNSIILPNVEIGPMSIVGAGSVVNKNVLPNSVYAGVPARKICSLNDYIEKYKSRMVPINADNRSELRRELTKYFWGKDY